MRLISISSIWKGTSKRAEQNDVKAFILLFPFEIFETVVLSSCFSSGCMDVGQFLMKETDEHCETESENVSLLRLS